MTKRQTSCKLAEQVGARIRFLRLELGWTLKALGKRAQMHASMLHGIEMGRTSTRVDTLRRIARALHVEPFELLNHDTEIDDVAYIVEKMRQNDDLAALVRMGLENCGMTAREANTVPAHLPVMGLAKLCEVYVSTARHAPCANVSH